MPQSALAGESLPPSRKQILSVRNANQSNKRVRDTERRQKDQSQKNKTEWNNLSDSSKAEIEELVETLKAVKQGDFSVRLPSS